MAPTLFYERIKSMQPENMEELYVKLMDFLADPPIENWSFMEVLEEGKMKEVIEWTLPSKLKKVAIYYITSSTLRWEFTKALVERCGLPPGGNIAYNGKATLVWFKT